MTSLIRQMPVTSEHAKIAKLVQLDNFYKTLTPRGQQVFNERTWAFNALPNDPKFIKCTFVPGHGWDLTEREAVQFISLIDGNVVSTQYQPHLETTLYESDTFDYIWIGFE